MEFWGIEIEPGKPFNVEQEDGYLIHVSQVTLGDFKKVGDETVQVYVEVLGDDKQKLLLGNLSQKIPQVSLDLMLERDFVLSHECKSSSVFILGYKTLDPMTEQLDSDFDSEDEEIPMDRFQSELENSNANGLNDQKANPEADESESDDEDESDSDEGYVDGDFEFFDPKPTDFHGVKMLLNKYLDDKEWDLSSFVDLILEQTTVGTMVKVADDEDESVFAVVSVLNLAKYKENKCFRELKEFLLQVCSEKNIASDLELLLEENAQDVGILVSQRVINLRLPLLPPLYDGLFDEVSWATEDEPTEELRRSFLFKSYLLITKIYKLRNPNQSKPDTVFTKHEDEIFLKLSSWSFTFPIRSQLVTPEDMRDYRPMGLVMSVEADKIPEFRQILHSLLD